MLQYPESHLRLGVFLLQTFARSLGMPSTTFACACCGGGGGGCSACTGVGSTLTVTISNAPNLVCGTCSVITTPRTVTKIADCEWESSTFNTCSRTWKLGVIVFTSAGVRHVRVSLTCVSAGCSDLISWTTPAPNACPPQSGIPVDGGGGGSAACDFSASTAAVA